MRTRYKLIDNTVADLFIKLSICSYPIDILNIFSQFNNYKVVSYSKHMRKYNLTEVEVIEHFGSEEGCTIFNPEKNRYLVFYNDLNVYYKKPERRRWTLAHELGHILLNHHLMSDKTKLFRSALSDDEYKWMEAEANHFASLLLAHPVILHKLNIKNNNDIINICQISDEASKYRFSYYQTWCKYRRVTHKEIIMLKQFHNYLYKRKCINCNHSYISKNAKYCPICGNKLIWGESNMFYDGFELNDNFKAIVCPNCGNEETEGFNEYCKICGTYLVNKCTNVSEYDDYGDKIYSGCDSLADGNARFCEVCGSKTTFLRDGLLEPWETAKARIESEIEIATDNYTFDDIPF